VSNKGVPFIDPVFAIDGYASPQMQSNVSSSTDSDVINPNA
jgi:hypothetical protein